MIQSLGVCGAELAALTLWNVPFTAGMQAGVLAQGPEWETLRIKKYLQNPAELMITRFDLACAWAPASLIYEFLHR